MNRFFAGFLVCFVSVAAFAQVPDPIITTMSSNNGYAVIAGKLNAKADAPVGISVRNGNLMYSTLTDADGRWGIVIRHIAVNVTVQSWDMKNPLERSGEVNQNVQLLRDQSVN